MVSEAYTIGHSTHSIEQFLALLEKHSITAVCDVRSAPYSRINPQFNRETLRDALAQKGISYVFLGKELGARPRDPKCYREGKVRYDLLAKSDSFRRGLDRVKSGSRKYRIALMCAEKDPLHCHRTILVSRELSKQGFEICHILSDGTIETHREATGRLLSELKIPPTDLFMDKNEIIEKAYRLQGDAIAYAEEGEDASQSDRYPQDASRELAE